MKCKLNQDAKSCGGEGGGEDEERRAEALADQAMGILEDSDDEQVVLSVAILIVIITKPHILFRSL